MKTDKWNELLASIHKMLLDERVACILDITHVQARHDDETWKRACEECVEEIRGRYERSTKDYIAAHGIDYQCERRSEDSGGKLTFGDLEVGDKFIGFPRDGDNHGHGGYKGTMRVMEKISLIVEFADEARTIRYHPDVPNGRARACSGGERSDIPLSMPVLRVQS